ncbi:MAG: carbon-nitrogen family hydrolase [Anaerolineae bacterium]|nr:carbon-nitrogen family hydrolase [Anaerolineae bacterium]
MAKLTISLAQMQIAAGDVRKNFAMMESLAALAAARKSKMIVFPELWSTGYVLEDAKEHASELNKGIFAQLSTVATTHKTCIAGSILEKRGLEVANSLPFFAPNGRMMGVYRKIHLFRLMEEDKYLQPGSSPLVLDLPWGVTGFAICYDLRFPELFRRYATQDNARMVIIPAEWPLARIEHWRALLVARAIENQCFIVACNAAGEVAGTVYGGHSMIVDPWGRIVVEAGEEPQLLTADIELDMVDEVRARIPVFEDLRHDVY